MQAPPEGMVVFRTAQFHPRGVRILFEAEQPATLNLVRRVVSELIASALFGGAVLVAYGWAVEEIRRLIARGALPFYETDDATTLDGWYDAALVGIEPTSEWTCWCIQFAQTHADRLLVDLDGLQAVGSEVLRGSDPRWHGLVTSAEVVPVWRSRDLIDPGQFLISGMLVEPPEPRVRHEVRERLGVSKDTRVLLYSGLVSSDFPDHPDIQLSTLDSVLGGVRTIAQAYTERDFCCLIRPHPRAAAEHPLMRSRIPHDLPPNMRAVWDPSSVTFDECVLAADVVACMPTSSFVVQAPYYGRLALVLALRERATGQIFDALFTSHEVALLRHMEYVKLARNERVIARALRDARPKPRLKADGGARVAQFLLGHS